MNRKIEAKQMGGFYEKKTTVQAGDDHVAGSGNDSRFRHHRIRRAVAAGYKRMEISGWTETGTAFLNAITSARTVIWLRQPRPPTDIP